MWGIKDLSQPVSVALQNTSKSQHSVTKCIVQFLRGGKKRKTEMKSWKVKVYILWTRAMCCSNDSMSQDWETWAWEWCLAAEFSNSFRFPQKLLEILNIRLFMLMSQLSSSATYDIWQNTWIQEDASYRPSSFHATYPFAMNVLL